MAETIVSAISFTPTTTGGHAGYFVGRGLHGTGVFVRSPLHARTILHGLLTRDERWDVVAALLQDDARDAQKAGAK
jgi:hypothetical protein